MSDATLAKLLEGSEAALLALAKLLTGGNGPISGSEIHAPECWLEGQAQTKPGPDQ